MEPRSTGAEGGPSTHERSGLTVDRGGAGAIGETSRRVQGGVEDHWGVDLTTSDRTNPSGGSLGSGLGGLPGALPRMGVAGGASPD